MVNSSIEVILRGIPVTIKKLGPKKYNILVDNSKLPNYGESIENLELICGQIGNYLETEGFLE